jgi:hypothetical protein
MLTLEELEAMSGIPADTLHRSLNNGLFDNGWIVARDPLRFHHRTVPFLVRTYMLLQRVEAGAMSMELFHDVLWTIARGGPDRLAEFLAPPERFG